MKDPLKICLNGFVETLQSAKLLTKIKLTKTTQADKNNECVIFLEIIQLLIRK